MLNRYEFIGNLIKDSEVRTFDNGGSVINFSVAVSEKYKDRDGTEKENTTFINCRIPVKAGGSTKRADYLKKGIKVFVAGKPSVRGYASGTECKASLECYVQEMELLTKPSDSSSSSSNMNAKYNPNDYGASPQSANNGEDLVDDDLPF